MFIGDGKCRSELLSRWIVSQWIVGEMAFDGDPFTYYKYCTVYYAKRSDSLGPAYHEAIGDSLIADLHGTLIRVHAGIAALEERRERPHDFNVEVEVHAAKLVEHEVANRVRRLELQLELLEDAELGSISSRLVLEHIVKDKSIEPKVVVEPRNYLRFV